MSSPENIQTEERFEDSESVENVEEQALQDATHEPGARIEESQTFEQAETVENALTEAVVAAEETTVKAVLQSESTAKPDEPKSQAQDPLTGKGYGEQSQEPGESSEAKKLVLSDTSSVGGQVDADVQAEVVTESQEGEQKASDRDVDPSQIDGYENEPTYKMDDQEPDLVAGVSESNEPLEGGTDSIDPQRISKEKLSEELLYPQKRPGMKGPGGGGKKPGSVPGSGGGPPVGGRGGGSRGRGGSHSEHSKIGRWLLMKSIKSGTPGFVDEPDGEGSWVLGEDGNWYYQVTDKEVAPAEKPPQGDPIDGDQPMPYTGGSTVGRDPDPEEPVGGLDHESGKIFPVYGKGTGSDRGGRTPGDKSGDDDSGSFLGDPDLDTSGVDTASPDPGDLDYNEANTLEEELQEKNGRQAK